MIDSGVGGMNNIKDILEKKNNKTKRKAVAFTFGRFQPPTSGHNLLIDKVISVAKKANAEHMIFPSRSNDPKKNPLTAKEKVSFMRKLFPKANIVDNDNAKTPFHAAKLLSDQGYNDVIMVVGGDRVKEFDKQIRPYINHKDSKKAFYFDSFKVVSAGKRDPDAIDVTGMSASKMRAAVSDNDFESFSQGVPTTNKKLVQKIFDTLKKRMGIKESVELDELDMAQRRKMSRTAKRTSKRRMKTKVRKEKRRKGSKEMKAKIGREVISTLKKKILKGRKWNELSFAERQRIEKKLKKIPKARVAAITKKMMPVAKKKEKERLSALRGGKEESVNEAFGILREPEVLDILVKKLMAKGMDKDKAYGVATSSLQKRGILKKGTHDLADDRDYKKEYDKYHSSPKARANRSKRVLARRKLEKEGKVCKGDGKDVDHKDGNPQNNSSSNLRVMSKGANRGRDNNKWRK